MKATTNNLPDIIKTQADATWLWSERKALNDWIRTYRNVPGFRK